MTYINNFPKLGGNTIDEYMVVRELLRPGQKSPDRLRILRDYRGGASSPGIGVDSLVLLWTSLLIGESSLMGWDANGKERFSGG
jgi:hypothetical protein